MGLTQPAMAELIGATKRSVINWEGGTGSPNAEAMAAIATVGADVQYILTGVRSANALAPDEEMLLTGYRALDARGKAGVFGMIGGLTQAPNHVGQQFNAPIHQVAGGDIINNEGKRTKQ